MSVHTLIFKTFPEQPALCRICLEAGDGRIYQQI